MIKYHQTFFTKDCVTLTLTLIITDYQIYHPLCWQYNLVHVYWWRVIFCTISICISFSIYKGPPLYSGCICSYLYALSTYHLTLWFWIPLMYSIQYYVVNLSVTCDCFLRSLQIKLTESMFNATAIWLKTAWNTKSLTNIDSFPIIEVQLDNKYREHLEI